MADRKANNSMNQMIGQLGDNRQPTQAANKLTSALQRSPSQRPAPRPMAPGVTAQRPIPRPVPGQNQLPIQNLPSQRPMPRPMPNVPGQNVPAAPGSKAPDFRGQPVFKPFPRPINAPGQRPDMYAGGTPNFDEMMGQYKPQPLPNVQDAFQQAYQQYNPQPIQQPMDEQARQFAQQQAMAPAQQQFPTYQPQPFNPYRKF